MLNFWKVGSQKKKGFVLNWPTPQLVFSKLKFLAIQSMISMPHTIFVLGDPKIYMSWEKHFQVHTNFSPIVGG